MFQSPQSSLLARLSGLRLQIFHPDSQSVRAFCESLTQLGCKVQHSWPPAARLSGDADLLLVVIDVQQQARLLTLCHSLREAAVPVIALANCHDARLFPLLLQLQPAAVAEREINPFALLVQITGTLQAVRHRSLPPRRGSERLTQAKTVLMQTFGLDEPAAYRLMRREAMNTRSSLESTAEQVINGCRPAALP